ncbi:TMEM175 family protein [Rhabdothermincola sediminis]|uniref:TMEM175 family protein n=1 Tax=Rhabdothermincola sediminis TaxID=2751370 RepID=UPI001AA0A2BC|nr:TMEM175 family protein [Rhabdothermincola sediminis]
MTATERVHLSYRPDYDVSRVRGFSDCVFAVAITLVVLSFVVPERGITNDELRGFLVHEWPRYLSYLGAFVVIGSTWMLHHRLFEVIVRVDGRALWINLALLSLVVLVPFPMQLLGRYHELPSAYVAFNLTALVLGLFGSLLVWYTTHRHRLIPADLDERWVRTYRWQAAVLPLGFAVATIGSVFGMPGAAVGWVVLGVGWFILRRRLGVVRVEPETPGLTRAGEEEEPLRRAEQIEVEARRAGRVIPFAAAYLESGRLERLLGFSDNLYAFAITVLVLHLQPPQGAIESNDDLNRFLAEMLHPDLIGYFTGFAVVGLLWHFHHRQFLIVEREDGLLRAGNLVHLMFVAVMPFATLVLSSYDSYPAATITFALAAGAASASLAALLWYVTTGHRLVSTEIPTGELRERRLLALIPPAAFVFSVPVALVAPTQAQLLWLGALAGLGVYRRHAASRAG